MQNVAIRPASLNDLPALTEIHNYYVLNTHITFDIQPFSTDQRRSWFHDHCDGRRYQLLVAEDAALGVLGYACTGRFRPKEAYSTTVEASVACRPDATGRGVGSLLYTALFDALASENIHRIVAGIAQPNEASNKLHGRFGFKSIGTFTQAGRKFDKYWDVMWMERPLMLNTHSPDE
jgi:phosphinothricin acetyltransferase